jgi:hypothetical protein
MRLYEFADPKDYIARANKPKHFVSQVERDGNFNALHRADKFSSRGRTRSDSQK